MRGSKWVSMMKHYCLPKLVFAPCVHTKNCGGGGGGYGVGSGSTLDGVGGELRKYMLHITNDLLQQIPSFITIGFVRDVESVKEAEAYHSTPFIGDISRVVFCLFFESSVVSCHKGGLARLFLPQMLHALHLHQLSASLSFSPI